MLAALPPKSARCHTLKPGTASRTYRVICCPGLVHRSGSTAEPAAGCCFGKNLLLNVPRGTRRPTSFVPTKRKWSPLPVGGAFDPTVSPVVELRHFVCYEDLLVSLRHKAFRTRNLVSNNADVLTNTSLARLSKLPRHRFVKSRKYLHG